MQFVPGQVCLPSLLSLYVPVSVSVADGGCEVWTPLIPSTMTREAQEEFSATPMGRPGQPSEVATCFVFLASQDSSFMSGQCLHPNGGTVVNG